MEFLEWETLLASRQKATAKQANIPPKTKSNLKKKFSYWPQALDAGSPVRGQCERGGS